MRAVTKPWMLLHTKSRQEKAVARFLTAAGLQFYLPLVDRVNIIRGRKVTAQVPLFPGYVFLCGDLDDGYAAISTRCVCRIVHVLDQERLLDELEQIREEAYNEGFSAGEKDGFHAGQLKGQQEARNALEARLGEFEQLMGQLMAPLQQQDELIEDMLLVLLEHMLRQLLQREVLIDRSQVVTVLRGALKALPVLILGGFTSIPGAIVGGLIIGVGEKIAEIYWGPAFGGAIEGWFAYMLALVFLLFRPQGLFGERIIERV